MKTKFGEASINATGYYQIIDNFKGNQGKYLHKLIFEDIYNVTLPNNYVVHHINKNKADNRIQNLQAVTKSIHVKFHNTGKILSKETKKKISFMRKGTKSSDETKKKLSILNRGKNNAIYGKSRSSSVRRSISLKKRGKGLFGFTGASYHKDTVKRPFECRVAWKSKMKYLCMFEDPLSCEIVHNIVTEELLKIDGVI